MTFKKILAAFFSVLAGWSTVNAEIKLPSILGSNMVLQRESTVNLWGRAEPGRTVTVTPSWDGKSYKTTVGADGQWLVKVQTPKAGGPYQITFEEEGGNTLKLDNILSGEVWICSGQSNMVHPVRGNSRQPVDESEQTIAEASQYKDIRTFTVAREVKGSPQWDCGGQWFEGSPESVAEVSATAYFFAKNLYKGLKIPVGIIVASWGSSRAEAWMSPEAIEKAGGVNTEALGQNEKIQKRSSVLYYSMILPIKNFTAKGFLWFQFGANRMGYQNYPAVLTSLIESWRTLWGDSSMPFINIQGIPYPRDGGAESTTVSLIIEKQYELVGKVLGYYMSSSTDLGDGKEPHHPQKNINGIRTANIALAHVYGIKGIKADDPNFQKVTFENGKAIVTFSNADDGLICKGDQILAFKLAGKDQVFYPAQARIINGSNVVEVSCKEVPEPVALRYAFQNYCKVSLYDKHGLTPRPYRTDNWDKVK